MVYGVDRSAVTDPPPLQGSQPKMSENVAKFSNFEFSLTWYLDIVKKNMYTDFGKNLTEWVEIIA